MTLKAKAANTLSIAQFLKTLWRWVVVACVFPVD